MMMARTFLWLALLPMMTSGQEALQQQTRTATTEVEGAIKNAHEEEITGVWTNDQEERLAMKSLFEKIGPAEMEIVEQQVEYYWAQLATMMDDNDKANFMIDGKVEEVHKNNLRALVKAQSQDEVQPQSAELQNRLEEDRELIMQEAKLGGGGATTNLVGNLLCRQTNGIFGLGFCSCAQDGLLGVSFTCNLKNPVCFLGVCSVPTYIGSVQVSPLKRSLEVSFELCSLNVTVGSGGNRPLLPSVRLPGGLCLDLTAKAGLAAGFIPTIQGCGGASFGGTGCDLCVPCAAGVGVTLSCNLGRFPINLPIGACLPIGLNVIPNFKNPFSIKGILNRRGSLTEQEVSPVTGWAPPFQVDEKALALYIQQHPDYIVD